MRTLQWSKDEISSVFVNCRNLEEVIEKVEVNLEATKEYLCGIHVNGIIIREDDEVKFAGTGLDEINELKISASRLEELVNDVFVSYLDWIPNVQEASVAGADKLRSGKTAEAQKDFAVIMEACQWFVESLVDIKMVLPKLGWDEEKMKNWQRMEASFSQLLKDILGAYEKNDDVLLADLMEYELPHTLSQWILWVKESLSEIPAVDGTLTDNDEHKRIHGDPVTTIDKTQDSLG